MLPCPLLHIRLIDLPLQIALIAHQYNDRILGFEFAQIVPLLDGVFEGGLAGVVEDEDDTMTAFEIGGDDWAIFLLSGGVPDVEFGELIV